MNPSPAVLGRAPSTKIPGAPNIEAPAQHARPERATPRSRGSSRRRPTTTGPILPRSPRCAPGRESPEKRSGENVALLEQIPGLVAAPSSVSRFTAGKKSRFSENDDHEVGPIHVDPGGQDSGEHPREDPHKSSSPRWTQSRAGYRDRCPRPSRRSWRAGAGRSCARRPEAIPARYWSDPPDAIGMPTSSEHGPEGNEDLAGRCRRG